MANANLARSEMDEQLNAGSDGVTAASEPASVTWTSSIGRATSAQRPAPNDPTRSAGSQAPDLQTTLVDGGHRG